MGLLFTEQDLNQYFADLLQDISCQDTTRAYLINLYATFKSNHCDLSQQNISLMFLQAKQYNDFANFQKIGDWVLFAQTIMPKHLHPANYYQDIARLSYYSCYHLINRQWLVYNELADNFLLLERQAIEKLHHLQIK